jgi:hypothetical protein
MSTSDSDDFHPLPRSLRKRLRAPAVLVVASSAAHHQPVVANVSSSSSAAPSLAATSSSASAHHRGGLPVAANASPSSSVVVPSLAATGSAGAHHPPALMVSSYPSSPLLPVAAARATGRVLECRSHLAPPPSSSPPVTVDSSSSSCCSSSSSSSVVVVSSYSPRDYPLPRRWDDLYIDSVFESNRGDGICSLSRCREVMAMPLELDRVFDLIRRTAMREARAASPCCFFIGITWRPLHRFKNAKYGYKWKGYTKLIPLTVVSAGQARVLEQQLISFFKNNKLFCSSATSTCTCKNKKDGGDGVNARWPSPYFVYIAIKPY